MIKMVKLIEKKGWVVNETIFEGDFFEGNYAPDLSGNLDPATFYECSECGEQYSDKFEAEECCKDEE